MRKLRLGMRGRSRLCVPHSIWRIAVGRHAFLRPYAELPRTIHQWAEPEQPVSNVSMRKAALAIGSVAAGALATWAVMHWRVDLPPVGPTVEQTCAEAMRAMGPDHSWVVPGHESAVETGSVPTVGFGDLSAHSGAVVRVAGVLHAEFDGVALYPSRAAMEQKPRQVLRVRLDELWPNGVELATTAPLISDRCVMIEGTYFSGWGGQFGLAAGAIQHVRRLDVWAKPHRPFAQPPPSTRS